MESFSTKDKLFFLFIVVSLALGYFHPDFYADQRKHPVSADRMDESFRAAKLGYDLYENPRFPKYGQPIFHNDGSYLLFSRDIHRHKKTTANLDDIGTFSIHIHDKTTYKPYGVLVCIGEMQIGTFKKTFDMPLDYWSKQDYETQWKKGIERLKKHNESCLITGVYDLTKKLMVSTWMLYKKEDTVHVEETVFVGPEVIAYLGSRPFTQQTCYNFIRPYTPGDEGKRYVQDNFETDSMQKTMNLANVLNSPVLKADVTA
ncbi:MAG TPA: hypothetical protein VGT41_04070 [Candidatus Babeliales bacterium]|nr:hypothetical protein [Candidatus Babeliales bacterium]